MTDILIQAADGHLAEDVRTALGALWPEAGFHLDPSLPHDAVLRIGGEPPASDGPLARPTIWLTSAGERETDDTPVAYARLVAPVRLAHVLHRLKDLAARPLLHDWHGYRLDMAGRTWRTPAGGTVLLTEKEVALLDHLGRCHPASVTRDDLLRDVWNYAAGADTHTVETHLYRLRQKIEADPDRPAIVVNNGDGYILGILS